MLPSTHQISRSSHFPPLLTGRKKGTGFHAAAVTADVATVAAAVAVADVATDVTTTIGAVVLAAGARAIAHARLEDKG